MKFQNKSSVGKPRIRWDDVVQSDALQMLGIPGWRIYGRMGRLVRKVRAQKALHHRRCMDGKINSGDTTATTKILKEVGFNCRTK